MSGSRLANARRGSTLLGLTDALISFKTSFSVHPSTFKQPSQGGGTIYNTIQYNTNTIVSLVFSTWSNSGLLKIGGPFAKKKWIFDL